MEKPESVDELKTWNFDGSSTGNPPSILPWVAIGRFGNGD